MAFGISIASTDDLESVADIYALRFVGSLYVTGYSGTVLTPPNVLNTDRLFLKTPFYLPVITRSGNSITWSGFAPQSQVGGYTGGTAPHMTFYFLRGI